MALRPVAVSAAPDRQADLELAQWTSSIYQLERHAAAEAGFSSLGITGDDDSVHRGAELASALLRPLD